MAEGILKYKTNLIPLYQGFGSSRKIVDGVRQAKITVNKNKYWKSVKNEVGSITNLKKNFIRLKL